MVVLLGGSVVVKNFWRAFGGPPKYKLTSRPRLHGHLQHFNEGLSGQVFWRIDA